MLRFPIDKGNIKVKCICGYSFNASPDEPELYKDARFDLSTGKKRGKGASPILDYSFKALFSRLINKILYLKYNIQNFKLLPTLEQRKILLIVIIIALIFIFILYILFYIK